MRAQAAINQAKGTLPGNLPILLALGVTYLTLDQPAKAVEPFAQVYKTELPDGQKLAETFYLDYAFACDAIGQTNRAEEVAGRGLDLYPESSDTLNFLAYSWAQQGVNLDKARDYAARAVQSKPGDAAYLDTLGWVCFKQKNYDQALEEVSKANGLMKDDPTITGHLGDVLDALGRRDEALEQWKKSFILDPDQAPVAARLQSLGVDLAPLRKEAEKNAAEREKSQKK